MPTYEMILACLSSIRDALVLSCLSSHPERKPQNEKERTDIQEREYVGGKAKLKLSWKLYLSICLGEYQNKAIYLSHIFLRALSLFYLITKYVCLRSDFSPSWLCSEVITLTL